MGPATIRSPAPEHRRLKLRRWTPLKPCGNSGQRLLTPLTQYPVAAFARNVANLEAGFKERVLYIDAAGTEPPPCVAQVDGLRLIGAKVAQIVGVSTPISATEYVASKAGSKRRIYERALRDLRSQNKSLGDLARLSFFVKREATCWHKRQVPRVISPRSPGFNILLGKYLKPIEHDIYGALARVVGSDLPVIAKGLTQQEKADIIVQNFNKFGMCTGIDAKRFDQHIRERLLSVEHGVYRGIYPNDPTLEALLREQLRVRGVGRAVDGAVSYSGPAMRCSGDVNTSLGNCTLTGLLATHFLAEHGIEGTYFADGDDCLLFHSPAALPLLERLPEWYTTFGLTMKVEEPARAIEQIEFCQSRVVWDGVAYNLVRSPFKVLNTTGFVPYKLTNKQFLSHCRAIGLCGLSMAAGIPILQPFYSLLVRSGITGRYNHRLLEGSGHQARIQMRAGHTAKCRPITPEARVSFWLAFGITPAEQVAIERSVERLDVSRQSTDGNLFINTLPFVDISDFAVPTRHDDEEEGSA